MTIALCAKSFLQYEKLDDVTKRIRYNVNTALGPTQIGHDSATRREFSVFKSK